MWNCGRHATNMNVGAVIVCRSRAPTAAVFMPSPRLNLSPNVITARVTRRRAQGADEYGRVAYFVSDGGTASPPPDGLVLPAKV
jgi:hypothetical protein